MEDCPGHACFAENAGCAVDAGRTELPRQSKLRQAVESTGAKSYEPRERTLWDRDSMPDGCDPDIWQLTLYFEDQCELYQAAFPGRPVVYENLRYRLTSYGTSAIRACARYCGLCVNWVVIVERSIDNFFRNERTTVAAIDNYCNKKLFEYYLTYTLADLERTELLRTGVRIPQPQRNVKPSRRTAEQREVASILQRKLSEEELQEKINEFRSRRASE